MSMIENDTAVFDVDKIDKPQPKKSEPPPYKVYEGARVAVSRAVGKAWKSRLDAAITAYTFTYEAWEEVVRYYNNNQVRTLETPRGQFKRGDSTENILFSNVNTILPAVASKNPEITCNTLDQEDEPFCKTLKQVLETLFKRRDKLNAKMKIKKAIGFALLTDCGVLKLGFTRKDDSREVVAEALQKLTDELAKAKGKQEVDEIYGKLKALEAQMEVSELSGPTLVNVLPSNLIVDPYAEMPDGSDANWMIERVFLSTEYLKARFTKETDDGDVLVYKPTHKASFVTGEGARDDGLGIVLETIDGKNDLPTSYSDEERLSYLYTYMTECYYVWDKLTRRVMLFQRDDWTWPLWVEDDPYSLTRFFPYYVMSFAFKTGGTVGVGETSYYLDQQDEVNDINRQWARIRRTVFDYFFYDTNAINSDNAEKLIKALRGETAASQHAIGMRMPENKKLEDVFAAILPPSADYAALFDKQRVMESANRVASVSDALRGVQFKTNTNEAAVNTYQDAVRLSVGAKVDVIEEVTADLALGLAEMCVQNYDEQDIAGLVGQKASADWKQMTVPEFNANYNLELVAGSMEKPNSVFKKKEAVQVAQAVGQFAQAAPGSALRIMLRVLEQAFTEVVIKPEDWETLDQEIQATLTKGVSTPQQGAASPPNGEAAQIDQLLQAADPATKERVAAGLQSGQLQPQQAIAMLKTGATGTTKGRRNGKAARNPRG